MKQAARRICVYCLLQAGSFLELHFDPEDECDMFLRNIS
jgi:hypothetical protein